MQLVALAGGLGKRLHGAIPDGVPKPMAPIAGKPFLEHLLDRAMAQGVNEIHLLVGYAANVIKSHFGDSYRGVPLTYSFEDAPLGTGGALLAAKSHLASEFLFVNGDTFADVDYRALLDLLGTNQLAMALSEIAEVSRYGSVSTSAGVVVGFREKSASGPGMINAGAYACRSDLLDLLPTGPSSFEQQFLEPCLPWLRPRFVMTRSPIIDIGTPESYNYANSVFAAASRTGQLPRHQAHGAAENQE
ncbi:NTP transferase domain-containing protein [Mycobacterium hodleri]|uniref:sugar phosphate nucleotidyltransferase n=1 Tax=Mycolicibacterium hodleri TaxID=49897 RepID=UPI0021F33EE0|nr:sugar phosphate nucleotidyltransferase [Mycolicibacterium hodleri]MCV7136634.1 NTP transferase domain-containing protein [Mycolicibacterium hodleri]